MRLPYQIKINTYRLIFLSFIIILWILAIDYGFIDKFYVSTPSVTLKYIYKDIISGDLWYNLEVTLLEAIIGLLLGSVLGILTGFALAAFPLFEKIVEPYLLALNALPRIALAPLLILWLGLGVLSKIAVSFSLVYFILVFSTRGGVKGVDEDVLTAVRLLGARRYQLITKVILPSCIPAIFSGIRLGVQYSLLGAVGAELIGAERGMGQKIAYFAGTFQVGGVFAYLIILALVSMIIAQLMAYVELRLLRWKL